MDSSQAPLISNHDHNDHNHDEHVHLEADDAALGSESDADKNPSVFVLLLTFAAGISGLLFGCQSPPETPFRQGSH